MNSQRLCDAGWQIMAGWCEPYAIRHDITWYFARVVFILLYYVLSSIRLYLCFVLCENIYIYITIYLSIYLLIYFIYLSFFIYSHVVLYCFLFIIYVYIYIERERDHIPLQRSNPTSSCLAASGCGVRLGPPKPPLGDSASAEWDSAAGPPNGKTTVEGWIVRRRVGVI